MKKIAVLSFLILGAGLLQADVIYTNLGTPFIVGSGTTVSGGGTNLSTAFEFVVAPGNSYILTEIDFVASLNSGTNAISATLYQDNGGVPGAALFSTGVTSNQLGSSAEPVEIEESVSDGPLLNSGGAYWLSLDGPTTSSITWNYNGDFTSGNLATFQDSSWSASPSHVLGAFQIDGTIASPEPLTVFLFAPGIAGLLIKRRLQLKQ